MRVVLQRVRRAAVTVDGQVVGAIGQGLFALVGVGRASTPDDAAWLARKTVGLRVFGDASGRMDRDLRDVGGGVLAVSQFTLYGDVRKGRRPSFVGAADPDEGARLYERYCEELVGLGVPVGRGVFGAMMTIESEADGPVTILLDRTAGTSPPG